MRRWDMRAQRCVRLGERAFETYRQSGVGGLAYAERACEGGVSGKMSGLGWMSFRGFGCGQCGLALAGW